MRLGFLGIGKMAQLHAKAAVAAGATIPIACALRSDSPHWEPFRKVAGLQCQLQLTAEGVLGADVEAFVVALPWSTIPPLMPRLLQDLRPMLIEKPVALRLAGSAAWFQHPHAHNKRVGYNRRFYESAKALRARIQQGGLKYVECAISEHLEHHTRVTGASVLQWLLPFTSCHTLDLLLHFLPSLHVESVMAYAEQFAPFCSYNGVLAAEHRGREVPVWLRINANDPSPVGFRCHFTDGTAWVLQPLERLSVYQGVEITESEPRFTVRAFRPREVQCVWTEMLPKPGFAAQMQAFLAGDYSVSAGLSDATRVLELIEALAVSWRREAA